MPAPAGGPAEATDTDPGAQARAAGRIAGAWRQWIGHLGPVAPGAVDARPGARAEARPEARPASRTAIPPESPPPVAPTPSAPPPPTLPRTAADHLLGLANIARFEWEVPTGRVSWVVVPIHDETLASVDHIDALLAQCHPSDIERLRTDIRAHVRGRQAVARSEFRLRTVRGTWRWHALCGRVVEVDAFGEPCRFAGLVQDIDERRRAMQTRSTQDALFADGPVRLFALGTSAGATARDLYAELAVLLSGGVPGERETPGAARRLRDVVHPDDLATLEHGVENARVRPGRPMPVDLRVTDGLGGWRRVRLQLAAERETAPVEGRPASAPVMHAYLLDVEDPAVAPPARGAGTERLQDAVAQLGTMQRFLQDLQRLNEALQVCDGESQAQRLVEQAATSLFPDWSGEIKLSDPEGHAHVLVNWGGELDTLGSEPTHLLSFPLIVGTQHGVMEMRCHGDPDEAALRHDTWAASSFAEALGLSLGNVRLREQAVQDWLTGLYNRRWFDEALRRESRRAQRSGEGLTLAILDVDHFKSFNDAFGHDAGDEVLRAVARELLAFGRATDTACRIGGEEMAVLMPHARLEDACDRLEDLRERIAALRLTHEGIALPAVTVSIGVADCEGGRAGNLHRRADIALYAAKHAGRNCVRAWEPGLEEHSGFAPLDARPSSLGL